MKIPFPGRRTGKFLALLLAFCAARAILLWARSRPLPRTDATLFVDVTRAAGLEYVFTIPNRPASPQTSYTILQTIGNGCAFLDYDNDGHLDILLVGEKLALYKGDGRGHFTEVTQAAGLAALHGHFLGCAVGDYDNDGYPDLYISGYHTGLLLHNGSGVQVFRASGVQGNAASSANHTFSPEHLNTRTPERLNTEHLNTRVFRDVTKEAGLKPQEWGTSCGFADLDGDGRLDLVIANYVDFGPSGAQICNPVTCSPQLYAPLKPTLYRNLGDGRFADVSGASGLLLSAGKGLALGFADYDGDGRQDIMFANDLMPGDLFHNDGSLHFTNQSAQAGTAFGANGQVHGGMGVDWADYDGDGRLDAFVSTFHQETKSLYHNKGNGLFEEQPEQNGLNATSLPNVAFGAKWLDYDNDGWPDLIVANGHIYNNLGVFDKTTPYRQHLQAFHNQGSGSARRFADESRVIGAPFQKGIVGRGLAVGDFDNDGRIDVLAVDSDGPPLLLHNEGKDRGNWLGLNLIGTGRSSRDALGARVTVQAGGRAQVKEVQTCGSYLSSSDKRLLFGLGAATRITQITIRWPDGRQQRLGSLLPNKYYTIRQPPEKNFP